MASRAEVQIQWAEKAADILLDRRIVEIRYMSDFHMAQEMWSGPAPIILVLDDGTKIYPARDPEGNGPGALFGVKRDGEDFCVPPV